MASAAHQVDDTKGRNMNMKELQNVYISFIENFIKF